MIELLLFYVSGVGLSISPCTLPLIPIALSIAIGEGRRTNLMWYCLGSITSYAALAYCYSLTHINLQLLLSGTYIRWSLAVLLLLLIMLLVVEKDITIRVPDTVYTWINQLNKSSFILKYLFGFFSTIIVSPCITVPLIAIFTYIENSGSVAFAITQGLMLGLGINTPLLLLGFSGIQFKMPQWGFVAFKWLLAISLMITVWNLL